ncbi:MAG: lipoate--protein ligase [Bacteroidales bacterium]|jgi:lipoate-protein ligase A|nr:lipoate--protein ligase [Bacteroidales bacterium]
MFCILTDSEDPFFNLAIEEYLLKNSREEYLILGVNSQAVIIGKHQVAHRETDTRYVTENNIPVIRRISGGGTVFHDSGNLNFSFLANSEKGRQIDFRRYTSPVINFLDSEGIIASLEGKNDLKTGGLKISGNAEHVWKERVLHHGTLLFDANLDRLRLSLRKDTARYGTRAVNSNPSQVTNISAVTDRKQGILDFRNAMAAWFVNNIPGTEVGYLTETEKKAIRILAEDKYHSWEWNYGYGPDYHFTALSEYKCNLYTIHFFVRDGIISECTIRGNGDLEKVAKLLEGCRHMPGDIEERLAGGGIMTDHDFVFSLF